MEVTKLERLSGVIGAMEMLYAFVSEINTFGRAVDDEFESALEQLHMLEKQLREDEANSTKQLRGSLTIDEAFAAGRICFDDAGKPYVKMGCAFTKEEFLDAMRKRHEEKQNAERADE